MQKQTLWSGSPSTPFTGVIEYHPIRNIETLTEFDSSYNGWSNYETWVVNLWLGNDEGSYETCRSLAERCFEEATADEVLSRKERACYQLANELKQMIIDGNPLASDASVYLDLLKASIGEVNWREIANGLLEDTES